MLHVWLPLMPLDERVKRLSFLEYIRLTIWGGHGTSIHWHQSCFKDVLPEAVEEVSTSTADLIWFYASVIPPVLEYARPYGILTSNLDNLISWNNYRNESCKQIWTLFKLKPNGFATLAYHVVSKCCYCYYCSFGLVIWRLYYCILVMYQSSIYRCHMK